MMITSGLENHSMIICNELKKSLVTEKVNSAFVNRYFLIVTYRYNELYGLHYSLFSLQIFFSVSKRIMTSYLSK